MVKDHILRICSDYGSMPSAPRICRILEQEYGIKISVGRVYRLLEKIDVLSIPEKESRWKAAGNDNGPWIGQTRQRGRPAAPNQVWESGITNIKAGGKDCSLCIVADLFSGRVIGWSVSGRATAELTDEAFENAYMSRGCPRFLMFCSERRPEYIDYKFRMTMERCGTIQSFYREEADSDGVCCKRFFGYLESRCLEERTFRDIDELRSGCFEYIECYNSRRQESSPDTPAPNEKEILFWERQK